MSSSASTALLRASRVGVVHGADPQSVIDKIGAMRQLEKAVYAVPDYLEQCRKEAAQVAPATQPSPRVVDEFCREQICEWSYRVVDYFDINRDVVAISLSFLDRFMTTCVCDRRTYKLAATTALFLAVKVHDDSHVQLSFLSVLANLSRGEFHEKHITEMERIMLKALGFRVHPPTAVAFINHFMLLPPFSIAEQPQDQQQQQQQQYPVSCYSSPSADEENALCTTLSRSTSRHIFDMACFYTELAVMDYYFVTKEPSLVALAAILEAMDRAQHSIPSKTYRVFLDIMERVIGNTNADELLDVQSRLRHIYERVYGSQVTGGQHFGEQDCATTTNVVDIHSQAVSPVSVIPQEQVMARRVLAQHPRRS